MARLAPESVDASWPMGLRRERAARYLGISPSKFDELVKRGLIPRARRLDTVSVWLRSDLDYTLEALPDETEADPYKDPAL